MGPCVRLIRALVAQPQPQPELTEEEIQKQWTEFKDTVKRDGWTHREVRISTKVIGRQVAENTCEENDFCTETEVSRMNNVIIDDENTLAGTATITYDDGTEEEAQVVHTKTLYTRAFGSDPRLSVDTTFLTPTKEGNIKSCINKNPFKCLTGTSITTDADGTRTLASVVVSLQAG
jgi:hypothetical protein